MNNLKNILIYGAVAVVFLTIAIGGWNLKRHINYKWSYQSQVQEEISKVMTNHIKEYHSSM